MYTRVKKASWAAALLGAVVIPAASAQTPTTEAPETVLPVSGKSIFHGVQQRPPACPTPSTIPDPVSDPSRPIDPSRPLDPSRPADPSIASPLREPTGDRGAVPGRSSRVATNMLGDLLYGTRSVRFGFTRTAGDTDFLGLASTSIVNSSVAENNSPIPQDRVYFRYHYYKNAQSVTGIGPDRDPFVTVTGTNPLTGVDFAQTIFLQEAQSRSYDVHQYTLGVEKMFFDGLASVEVRLPMNTTLASSNVLSVGNPVGFATNDGAVTDSLGNPFFLTEVTADQTLGRYASEFGNMNVILKALLYQDDSARFTLSGGVGILIPTGRDSRTTVIDYGSTLLDINGNPAVLNSGQRRRDIAVANETWSLSPFLAFVVAPSERFFTQGFASIEFPLNKTHVTYNDQFTIGRFPGDPLAIAQGNLAPPFSHRNSIAEQTLLHLDVGVGFWLMRQPERRWLTGIAPTAELHYTSTLNDAAQLQLPGNAAVAQLDPNNPTGAAIPEIGPVVGNPRNRVDILNLTLGTTLEFGSRATLGTGVVIPLSSGDNKAFDWEFQMQFNYYFGSR